MLRDIIRPIHVIIAVTLVGAILLVTVLVKVYEAANPVVIKKVPSDTRIFVDEKEIGGGRANIANGIYTVRAERAGFETATFKTIINDDTKYIAVALSPSSDEARKWAKNNERAYLDLEKFVGSSVENSGKSLAAANPIVTSLPLSGDTYDIGYIKNPKDPSGNSIILTVHALEGYRNGAVRSLYDAGYNPAEYSISFEDLSNPFTKEGLQ